MLSDHPGDSAQAHTIRFEPEPVPATILCCPIINKERRVTMACLEEYGLESVVLRWLDPDSPYALKYGMFKAIKEFWTGEKDLIHIDHDMVFIWDHLRDLSNCGSPWCTCPYYGFGHLITAPLGFVKFSAELQRQVSLDEVIEDMMLCPYVCGGEWWGVEWHLMRVLGTHGFYPCMHIQALNDHSQFGLYEHGVESEKIMSVDWRSPEGRAIMMETLRAGRGDYGKSD